MCICCKLTEIVLRDIKTSKLIFVIQAFLILSLIDTLKYLHLKQWWLKVFLAPEGLNRKFLEWSCMCLCGFVIRWRFKKTVL